MLKISSVGAYVSAPTRADVREVALRCIDAFDAARRMFASHYPPARLHTSFGEIFEAFVTRCIKDDSSWRFDAQPQRPAVQARPASQPMIACFRARPQW